MVTLACMLYAGEPRRPRWWLGFAPFAAWALLPFLVAGILSFRLRGSPASRRVLLAAAGLLTASTCWLLYVAFIDQPDAQSGLVFLFLPLWQLVGLLPIGLLAAALGSRSDA